MCYCEICGNILEENQVADCLYSPTSYICDCCQHEGGEEYELEREVIESTNRIQMPKD